MTQDWEHIDDQECRRFTGSLELIGKRWSSGILLAIARGAARFSDIVASVAGLSDRLLAQRLKELEREGLIVREVIATTPVQVRYHLSARGADLMRSLQPLVDYGQRWEDAGEGAGGRAMVQDRTTQDRTTQDRAEILN